MKWYRSKTIWTGIIAIITAGGAYFTGEADLSLTLTAVFTALMAIFLRKGIASGPQ